MIEFKLACICLIFLDIAWLILIAKPEEHLHMIGYVQLTIPWILSSVFIFIFIFYFFSLERMKRDEQGWSRSKKSLLVGNFDYFPECLFLVQHSWSWWRFNFFFRFDGAAAEPRKGIRSGHVPGSKCIPFAQVNDQNVMWCLLCCDDLIAFPTVILNPLLSQVGFRCQISVLNTKRYF